MWIIGGNFSGQPLTNNLEIPKHFTKPNELN